MKFILLLALLISSAAQAEVVLVDKDGFKFSFSGFIEADAEHDTTRSFTEIMGNKAVATPGTPNGENGRTQFSIRNTRMAFKLIVPEVYDWKTLGYMEYDLLGNAAAGDSSTYTSPSLRLRHGYIQTEKNGWQITAGQTWQLLGWQPYYFVESVDVMPLPASLYSRTEQLRGMKTLSLGERSKVEVAAAILRPPQADGSMPDFQAGARFSTTALESGASGSSSGPRRLMPLSVAVSGAFRQFAIQDPTGTGTSKHNGYAFAADTMIPILPSRDGKSFSNTISLFGEFTFGQGDGDQFNQWSGGTTAVNGTNAPGTTNLDAGIGLFDGANFELIHLLTWNTHLQYQLPWELPDFIDVGYMSLYSSNAMDSTAAPANDYNQIHAIFANWFHDFTPNLRSGLEYVYDETTLKNAHAHDSRYQASAFFFF